jgi:hypothetical protein
MYFHWHGNHVTLVCYQPPSGPLSIVSAHKVLFSKDVVAAVVAAANA